MINRNRKEILDRLEEITTALNSFQDTSAQARQHLPALRAILDGVQPGASVNLTEYPAMVSKAEEAYAFLVAVFGTDTPAPVPPPALEAPPPEAAEWTPGVRPENEPVVHRRVRARPGALKADDTPYQPSGMEAFGRAMEKPENERGLG